MAKINFKPAISANTLQKQFGVFSENAIRAVQRNQNIDAYKFSSTLQKMGDSFVAVGQQEVMNKGAKRLAETLASLKNDRLAGMVYSFLIKFNAGNEVAIEEFATNGLKIAKRLHDPIHIMARANDLKILYGRKTSNQEKLLKVLFEEKRALNDIVNDYEGVQKRFCSLTRQMRPRENYEEKLAAIKLDIAEILVAKNDNHQAIVELKEALAIYERIGKGKNSEKIEKMLSELTGVQ